QLVHTPRVVPGRKTLQIEPNIRRQKRHRSQHVIRSARSEVNCVVAPVHRQFSRTLPRCHRFKRRGIEERHNAVDPDILLDTFRRLWTRGGHQRALGQTPPLHRANDGALHLGLILGHLGVDLMAVKQERHTRLPRSVVNRQQSIDIESEIKICALRQEHFLKTDRPRGKHAGPQFPAPKKSPLRNALPDLLHGERRAAAATPREHPGLPLKIANPAKLGRRRSLAASRNAIDKRHLKPPIHPREFSRVARAPWLLGRAVTRRHTNTNRFIAHSVGADWSSQAGYNSIRIMPRLPYLLLFAAAALPLSLGAQLVDQYNPPPSSCCQASAAMRLANALQDWDQLGRFHADDERLKAQPDPNRVVFLGDSITDFWKLDVSFPGKPYVNRGISGQVTSQML